MSCNRYVPKIQVENDWQPFGSAEEAWLWYCGFQLARMEGATFRDGAAGPSSRPCDPDDVFTAVDRLYKAGVLRRCHLAVLGDYGSRLTIPLYNHPDERAAARCWSEALVLLTPVLKAKGIVL